MKCLIGIDDKNLIVLVENMLKKIDKYIYVESTSNLETVKKLLQKNQYDFMLASCCQNQDHSQKMLGWIRAMKIDIEVIYITRYKDVSHIQQAFRYGVCDYLLLPFDFDRFKFAIQRVIDRILFLNSQTQFTQKEIDDYISVSCLQYNVEAPAKTNNNPTMEKVKECILTFNEPFTSEQVAEKIGLSRITVRRYLENLVDEKTLDTHMEYGSIGRPHKLYTKNKEADI